MALSIEQIDDFVNSIHQKYTGEEKLAKGVGEAMVESTLSAAARQCRRDRLGTGGCRGAQG